MPGAGAGERAALYRFLARAYLAPPDDDLLALAAEVPELAPFAAGAGLAERHTELFDLHVYPYAGVFLDPSGMLDSPWSGFVAGVYRALGFEVMPGAGLAGPDHLSAQLEALSALLDRESGAGSELAAERARHGQRTLLREQLAPWLPSFLAAIRRIDRGFYGGLAGLTEEVVIDHAEALWGMEVDAGGEAGANLVANPDPESSDKGRVDASRSATDGAGGREFAGSPPNDRERAVEAGDDAPPPGFQRLLIRAHGGLFLSRADLAHLGERMTLPLRFAERRFMLDHLVRGAAERNALPTLATHIAERVAAERATLLRWSTAAPPLTQALHPWLTLLATTTPWLIEIATEATEPLWREPNDRT